MRQSGKRRGRPPRPTMEQQETTPVATVEPEVIEKQNIAVQVGTRQSSDSPGSYSIYKRQVQVKTIDGVMVHVHPLYPGYHCSLVTIKDAFDPVSYMHQAEREGMGYEVLSKDPAVTGSGVDILMGCPISIYVARESERVREVNMNEDDLPDDLDINGVLVDGGATRRLGEAVRVNLPNQDD